MLECRKTGQYPTRRDAKRNLHRLRGQGIGVTYIYWCEYHQAYELTSQPRQVAAWYRARGA